MKISEVSFKDSPFTYLQYIERLAAWSTYVQNYAIFLKTTKLPSLRTPGPVFVHRQNNISPRKHSTQTDVSATLLSAYRVFSYAFRIANALLPFPLALAFLTYFWKGLLCADQFETSTPPPPGHNPGIWLCIVPWKGGIWTLRWKGGEFEPDLSLVLT